jgi:hypothetical protein
MPALSVTLLLVLIAFGLTLWHGVTGKPALWVAVLLLCIVHLIGGWVR